LEMEGSFFCKVRTEGARVRKKIFLFINNRPCEEAAVYTCAK